ncbi:MAG TPA: PilZ domain-containing protein [Pyrinomonadaceae bacterium]|jgi:hypothetical protein
MTNERRRAARVLVNLPVQWEGVLEKHIGTISDLSLTGCFVLTDGEVKDGELIYIEINVPSLMHMQLSGEVVYSALEIGFALRFNKMSATEQMLLDRLVDHFRKRE